MSWWKHSHPKSVADQVKVYIAQLEAACVQQKRDADPAAFDQITMAMAVVLQRRLQSTPEADVRFVDKLATEIIGVDQAIVHVGVIPDRRN